MLLGAVVGASAFAAACSPSPSPVGHSRAVGSRSSAPRPSAPLLPTTSTTGPAENVNPPTTIIDYGTYAPSYDTIGELVHDSEWVFVGTLMPRTQQVADWYPISPGESLAGTELRQEVGVSSAEVAAAHMTVGQQYLVFYGIDNANNADNGNCVVGGTRGVFAVDPATEIVTRLDDNPSSSIPRTQTLAAVQAEISDYQAHQSPPLVLSNSPPVCAASATGLSS